MIDTSRSRVLLYVTGRRWCSRPSSLSAGTERTNCRALTSHSQVASRPIGWLGAISFMVACLFQAGSLDVTATPLEKQTLSFTATKGTWISLDVSPSGEAIVFDLLGDLYTIPSTGGNAQRLTRGTDYDSQPRFSPDGQWIAFVSDRDGADNLWMVSLDGKQIRRLSDNLHSMSVSPVWMPDGAHVLIAENIEYLSDPHLRIYSLDASAVTHWGSEALSRIRGLGGSISPNGRYLYFSARNAADEARYNAKLAQVVRLDLKTGETVPMTNGPGGGVGPVLSPDGTALVYATRRNGCTALRVRDLRTGTDRQLVSSVQSDVQNYQGVPRGNYIPGYSFTPDGRFLVASYRGGIHRIDIDTGAAKPIPFTAAVSIDIARTERLSYSIDQGPVRARILHHPSLSPNGKELAMSILTKVYLTNVDSSVEPRRLTAGETLEFQPTWSPDGKWIAYVAWTPGLGGHIQLMQSNGAGDPRNLTSTPAFYTDLAYSPDGRFVAAMRGVNYMRTQDPNEQTRLAIPLDLVLISTDDGEVTVVEEAHTGRHPHFANDSSRIYTSTGHALSSVNLDGANKRTHLRITGRVVPDDNDMPVAERMYVHPDGRQVLALVNKQVWYISISDSGGVPTWNVRESEVSATRLTDIGADFIGWQQNGSAVGWAIGSTFYRRPLAGIDSDAHDDSKPRDQHPAVERIPVRAEFPRARPEGTLVLRGATVIPMTIDATTEPRVDADVVVVDNRIRSIGARGEIAIPDDAIVLDLGGKFIVPGFVDTHAHWAFPVREILEPENWTLRANLAYGVTSGLDVQTNQAEYFAYQDMVETGQSLGPRAFMVGPGIFGANNYKPFETDFRSYEDALFYLTRYQRHYRTHNVKSYLVGDRRQRQWLVSAARELNLMPTAEGFGDLKLGLTHALDGMHGNEHVLIDSAVFADVLTVFATTQTSYTPTLNITHYGAPGSGVEYFLTRTAVHEKSKLAHFYPPVQLDEKTRRRSVWLREDAFNIVDMAQQAAGIQRAGGLLGVGSHGEVQGLSYHWEMWLMAMGGMTPYEILRAATIDGARIIGVSDDVGTLEPGKLADLVVLDANPLVDIHNTAAIRYVMKNGELFEADRLIRVWPTEGSGAAKRGSSSGAQLLDDKLRQ